MSLVITPSPAQQAQGMNRYTISRARSFHPALPRILAPHQTWTGSFAGIDAVPRNQRIYVGFGPFLWNSSLRSGTTSKAIVIH
jgi:hypothetical protein